MKIKNIRKHFSLVCKHRWIVFKLCTKVGEPWRGFTHDLSKFSATEFWEGVKYFDGTHSPIIECKKKNGYSKAWLHHKGRNKHHAEYWMDLNAPDKTPIMPYEYLVEMICDKLAAGITYQGNKWNQEYPLQYWMKEKDKIKLNEKMKELITELFTQISERGIKNSLTKTNMKRLYKEKLYK